MFRRSIGWIPLLATLVAWPAVATAQYEIDIIISDSGRNNAWSPALAEDPKRPGLTFSARGKDGKPVGGILADTVPLQQLLVGMPPDNTLKVHRNRLRDGDTPDYQRRLFRSMQQHTITAIGNSSPVFEIRLLQHAAPTGDQATQTARLKIFAPQVYAALGRVIDYWHNERDVRVHVTAALSDTGAEGFALASEAWRPYANLFRRVDIVDGHASLPQVREIIEILGAKRVRLFTSTGTDSPAMTVGREEIVDRLLREHPGLIHYRFDSLATASRPAEDALLPWHEHLAGQRLARITRRRNRDGTIAATQLPDPLAPQQFRPPMTGWSPQARSALLSLATAAPTAADAAIESLSLADLSKVGSTINFSVPAIVDNLKNIENAKKLSSSLPQKLFLEQKAGHLRRTLIDELDRGEVSQSNAWSPQTKAGVSKALKIEGAWSAAILETTKFGKGAAQLGGAVLAFRPEVGVVTRIAGAIGPKVGEWSARDYFKGVENHDLKVQRVIGNYRTLDVDTPASANPGNVLGTRGFSEIGQSRNSGQHKSFSGLDRRFQQERPQSHRAVARQFQRFDVSSFRSMKLDGGFPGALKGIRAGTMAGMLGNDRHLTLSTATRPQNVKGVLLQAVAQFEGDSVRLHASNVGLVFQDAGGGIDIPRLRRFVTAMWAAYLSVEGPGISINPIDSAANKQQLQRTHNVQYIGQVEHTDLGRVMREADYIMKQWAVGTVRPDIPTFLTPEELGTDYAGFGRPSRFWILPENLRFSHADDMLLFESGNMLIETEYLGANPKNEVNPANEKYAEWFTKNYHGVVSAKYPVYEELFEYAQLTSLGTFLRESRVPMLWFLMANREMLLTEESVKELPRLQLQSNRRWFVSISGGVVMDMTSAVQNPDSYRVRPEIALGRALADVPLDGEQWDEAVRFRVGNEQYATASSQSMALSASKAKGEIVQTDMALWRQYSYPRDEPVWKLTTPGLELVRHYNPELQSRAEFGGGWHILVPYRLEDAATSRPLSAISLPRRVAVINQLSGVCDVMQRVPGTSRYEPVDEDSSLAKALVRREGGWLLQDRLACTMQFDLDGDMLRMRIRPASTVLVKLPDGKGSRQKVDGYEIRYRYERTGGDSQKVLTEIKQGSQIAKIEWASDGTPKIMQIRGLQDGVAAATVEYAYGDTGGLQRVLFSEDLQFTIQYIQKDNHTVVLHEFARLE